MALQVIVGGQFGSEAKGAVTAAACLHAVRRGQEVIVVRVGGPNAGHSAADPTGRVWALRQVPAGMVADPTVYGVIASGSEIDLAVLYDEIERLEAAGIKISDRLTVSAAATMIHNEHREAEVALVGRIGSTGKGIGAARADRIMRVATTAGTLTGDLPFELAAGDELERWLNAIARYADHAVIIEGTQGYGLGLHTQYYPQTTSGDCRAIDVLAQAGVNPWGFTNSPYGDGAVQIHLAVRPYPIRVAGNSGPLKGETSWAELDLPEELTTVTRKVRRVGAYDKDLVDAAIAANAPNVYLAVSMVDQVQGAVDDDGKLTPVGERFLTDMAIRHGTKVRWYGTGPTLADWSRWS